MAQIPSTWSGSDGRDNPYWAINRMQRDIDRLFDTFFPASRSSTFGPAPELREAGDHYLLRLEVPGFKKEEVTMEVQGTTLHVWGERGQEKRKDRTFASFDRWFTLPQGAKLESIEAKMENGELEVAIPKAAGSQTRKIPIGDGQSGFFRRSEEKIFPAENKKESAA